MSKVWSNRFDSSLNHFIEEFNRYSKPLTKDYILKNIWGYSSDTDTHTVETHIYRLRQKIKNKFNDEDFIKHTPEGYSFWKKEIFLPRICLQKSIREELLILEKARAVLAEKNLRSPSSNYLNNLWGHLRSFFKTLF